MSTVYVVQEPLYRGQPKFSLEPARQYGTIRRLLDWEDGRVPFPREAVLTKLLRGLADYTADDYILLAGHPVAIALAAMVAAEMSGGKVQLLSFNKLEGAYEVVCVDLDQLPEVVS